MSKRQSLFLTVAALAVAGSAAAQAPPAAPADPPRAKAASLATAVPAAQAAVAACAANGYKVTTMIVDAAGEPIVMLSGDGAPLRTQNVVKTKIAIVMKYKTTSGEVVEKAKTDPALAAALKADPAIGVARQGGVPIMIGGEMVGAFAVSGAPGGDKDEACIRAALAKVPLAL